MIKKPNNVYKIDFNKPVDFSCDLHGLPSGVSRTLNSGNRDLQFAFQILYLREYMEKTLQKKVEQHRVAES